MSTPRWVAVSTRVFTVAGSSLHIAKLSAQNVYPVVPARDALHKFSPETDTTRSKTSKSLRELAEHARGVNPSAYEGDAVRAIQKRDAGL